MRNLPLHVQALKQVEEAGEVFTRPQKQQPAGVEGVMKHRNEAFLQSCTQINKQVAANEQVELGERRVLVEVVHGKHHRVAHLFFYPIAFVDLGKEAVQALRAHIGHDVFAINSGAGRVDAFGIDIGGENLNFEVPAPVYSFKGFEQANGQTKGFFAGRATRGPHPKGAVAAFPPQQGQQVLLQMVERLPVAEKLGHPNQQLLKQGIYFGWGFLQKTHIVRKMLNLVRVHAPLDAPEHGIALIKRKVVPGAGPDEVKNFLESVDRLSAAFGFVAAGAGFGMAHKLEQLGGQLGRG